MLLFNQLLRKERLRNNLDQSEVTALTGIPRTKISRYENAHQIPSPTNLDKLIQCYGPTKEVERMIRATYIPMVLIRRKVRGNSVKSIENALDL
ncbi:MAG: helix-turn-helix domain-containing protein [Clostridia bacterium]